MRAGMYRVQTISYIEEMEDNYLAPFPRQSSFKTLSSGGCAGVRWQVAKYIEPLDVIPILVTDSQRKLKLVEYGFRP